MRSRTQPHSDDAPQYVFVPRVRCPSCDSTSHKTIRSIKVDEIQRRTTVCLDCGQRFYVVVE